MDVFVTLKKLALRELLIGGELPRGIWERFLERVGKERCLSLPPGFCVESECLTMTKCLVRGRIPLALLAAAAHLRLLARCVPERKKRLSVA